MPIPSFERSAENSRRTEPFDILEDIRRSSVPRAEFYFMNLFATVVASYGLLANSTAVVIGAMVIAALLGPISGIGLALVTRDLTLLRRAGLVLATGTVEVFVIAFLIGTLHNQVPLTPELLARTQPNLFDLIIAFAGGAAGAYAVGRRVPGGSLIGVAIATALVPPIASSAIAAAHGTWELAQQAFLLFITNLVAIQCAYSIVLYALDIAPIEFRKRSFRTVVRMMAPSLVLLAALAIVLGAILKQTLNRQQTHSHIRGSIEAALSAIPGAYLGDVVVAGADSAYDVIASVRTPTAIAPDTVRAIEQSIRQSLDRPVRLTVRSMLLRVANRTEYLYQPEALRAALDQPQVGSTPIEDTVPVSDSIRRTMTAFLSLDSIRLDSTRRDSIVTDSLYRDSLRAAAKQRSRR